MLQDLVTEALAGDAPVSNEPEASSANQIFRSDVSPGAMLHSGRQDEDYLREASGEDFHFRAATLASRFLALSRKDNNRYRWSIEELSRCPSLVGGEIFSRSADYLNTGEGRDSLLSFIHQALDNYYLEKMFQSPAERIAKLSEIWEDDLPERLSILGSVKPATAKRWIAGAFPASAEWQIRKAHWVVFHLESSAGMSPEEIRTWFEEPLADGRSPFQHIVERSSTRRAGGTDIEKDALTLALEYLGIIAFSWAADI